MEQISRAETHSWLQRCSMSMRTESCVTRVLVRKDKIRIRNLRLVPYPNLSVWSLRMLLVRYTLCYDNVIEAGVVAYYQSPSTKSAIILAAMG